MRRRKFVGTVSVSATTILAGCASNSSDNGGSPEEDDDAPFELLFDDDNNIVATFDRDSDIAGFQIIGPDGAEVGSMSAGDGAESRVTLMKSDLGESDERIITGVEFTDHIDETLEIIAFNEESEEIGDKEFSYSPSVNVLDTKINNEEKQFEITLENSIQWPVELSAEIIFPIDQVQIDPVELETSGDPDLEFRDSQLSIVSGGGGGADYSIESEDQKMISEDEETTITIPYELVDSNIVIEGFGTVESFRDVTLEDAENIEEQFSVTGTVNIELSPSSVEEYELELIFDNLITEVENPEHGSSAVFYNPGDIILESFEEV